MNRVLKALGAFALTLVLTLTLAAVPFDVLAAEAPGGNAAYAGYLVILTPQAEVPAVAGLMAEATLFAASSEREELLPLAESVGVYKANDLSDIQNLVYSGQVQLAEPDYEAQLFADNLPTDHADPTMPNDPYFIDQTAEYQFNLKDSDKHGISVRAAWEAGLTGEGVTVAVIDSGLNGDHVDVPLKVARGRYYYYREMEGGRYEFTINGVTRYYNYYSSDYVADDVGHGTMVSGIIAAQKDNGRAITGIAPNVTLMPVRCFTKTAGHLGGYTSNLISGVTYAMENGADIINMSWGITNESQALHTVITEAANKGCILIAAVGNDGNTTVQYPAMYDNVIGVGSTDKSGYLSDFSQRNASVAVCAPGGSHGGQQIYSLGYSSATAIAKGDGTSFSAPMVAAAAALLKEADPHMTQTDFLNLLEGNCDPVLFRTGDNPAHAGRGLLNLEKLLDAMGYAGATANPSDAGTTVRAAYHPVQSASRQPDSTALILLGAYNAQGHLLDSKIASAGLSKYGAYVSSAQFDVPEAVTYRAFYLKDDATLSALADPAQTDVG